MTVFNFLKNREKFELNEVRYLITNEALGRIKVKGLLSFEENYKKLYTEYFSTPSLALSSTSFELDKLPSFNVWLNELSAPQNITKFMPFIISKMMDEDALSLSVYNMIYQKLGKEELLFSQQTYDSHPELKEAVYNSNSGAGVGTYAVLNAEHWLNSLEGKRVLCTDTVYKEDIEDLLAESC